MGNSVRVAAVQAEPVWMDLNGSIEKTIDLIAEAAGNGAKLVVFPELWITGYPVFMSYVGTDEEIPLILDYRANSLVVASDEMARVQTAAKEHGISVVLGFSERGDRSLFISQALIDADGRLVFHRRKLKPTYRERAIFGQGDGSDLIVADSPIGRIGALNCWEHLQPINKHAMIGLGEQIHAAAWPVHDYFGGEMLSSGTIAAVMRSYAIETGTFVIMASSIFTERGREAHSRYGAQIPEFQGGGCTRVFGPDGSVIADSLPSDVEGILYGDINLVDIEVANFFTDPAGHYSRPDIFSVTVDTRRKSAIDFIRETRQEEIANISGLVDGKSTGDFGVDPGRREADSTDTE